MKVYFYPKKKKKTKRARPRAKTLKPYNIGEITMSKKKKGKRGHSRGRSLMSGDPGRCGVGLEGAGRTAFNTLGQIALAFFGAVAASFVSNKIPASWPASRHLKVLTPVALGLGAQNFLPKRTRALVFPAACGAYAVAGVTAAKTYLPGIPLMAGDVAALEVPQYTMGTDAEGRLIDTRDGSLLLDEQGRTLNGDGTPRAEQGETSMIQGETQPGEMLGGETSLIEGGPGDMLGGSDDEEDLFA